jgi:CBS domain-containing protein
MRVRDLLRHKDSRVVTVTPGADVAAAVRLMMAHGVGGLPVVAADGSASGFVAERDIVRALGEHDHGTAGVTLERIMQKPATCSPDDPLQDVMARMTRHRLRHLVVTEGGKPTAVISVGDLVKHRLEQLETETGVLRDYVAAQRAST